MFLKLEFLFTYLLGGYVSEKWPSVWKMPSVQKLKLKCMGSSEVDIPSLWVGCELGGQCLAFLDFTPLFLSRRKHICLLCLDKQRRELKEKNHFQHQLFSDSSSA